MLHTNLYLHVPGICSQLQPSGGAASNTIGQSSGCGINAPPLIFFCSALLSTFPMPKVCFFMGNRFKLVNYFWYYKVRITEYYYNLKRCDIVLKNFFGVFWIKNCSFNGSAALSTYKKPSPFLEKAFVSNFQHII